MQCLIHILPKFGVTKPPIWGRGSMYNSFVNNKKFKKPKVKASIRAQVPLKS